MTGLLKVAQQKVFGLGKSKAAEKRRSIRERVKLFVAAKPGGTVEISGRVYRVAPDGSFRLRASVVSPEEMEFRRACARKRRLDEQSQTGIRDSRDKSRLRTGKEKRAGYFATRPAAMLNELPKAA